VREGEEMLKMNEIYNMDCIEGLKQLDNNSIHCCVTSPPYWNLRDYGVPGQIGLEDTLELYLEKMVEVFREVRRVLASDGTLWLNLGDSYSGSYRGNNDIKTSNKGNRASKNVVKKCVVPEGLKEKDLCGIPWRVAFALQADGWYLRSDIIWAKPNPMPESVIDRPTKAHEYIFLMSKSSRYYYDCEAIKEPCVQDEFANGFRGGAYCNNSTYNNSEGGKRKSSGNIVRKFGEDRGRPGSHLGASVPWEGNNRNKRSVWTIASGNFPEAHFATFPPKLIEPCILAGCPKDGIVLDPFMGSGTTAQVALQLQRNFIGFELNPEYIKLAENHRLNSVQIKMV
jgi:DNA modification methylase